MGEPSSARVPGTRTGKRRGAVSTLEALPEGTLIAGKYRVISLLGEGGMGAVYRAEHVTMQRQVALKVMRPQYASDPSAVARFEREAQAASRISTPHVVTIYDFGGSEDEQLYLVMELLEGESLAERIDRAGPMPWADAIDVAVQIARALAVAHEAGVVHRDLKPENVFLCADGVVKVLDFGIARVIAKEGEASSHLTQTGAILGTALYMSPEAVAREPVGPPADLYALGAILFELLTGRVLFEEENPVLVMGAHLRMPPERVLEAKPELSIPAALDGLVDQLLAKDPAARPISAAAVCEQLQQMLVDDAPLATGTPRAEPEPVPPPSRSRAPMWIALGVTAAAAIGVAVVYALPDEPAPVAAIVPEQEPVRTGAPAPEPAPAPRTVELAFAIVPADADLTITHDGAAIEGRALTLEQDDRAHTFVFSAPGFVSLTREVRADRDREIAVVLEPAPRPAKARPVREERAAQPRQEVPREEEPREPSGSVIRSF
jgi:hypothetical protein